MWKVTSKVNSTIFYNEAILSEGLILQKIRWKQKLWVNIYTENNKLKCLAENAEE